jgi:hypothetical protein
MQQQLAHLSHGLEDASFSRGRKRHAVSDASGEHEEPVWRSAAVDLLDQDALHGELHHVGWLHPSGTRLLLDGDYGWPYAKQMVRASHQAKARRE